MQRHGWQNLRLVLPLLALSLSVPVVVTSVASDIRADKVCEQQTRASSLAPERESYGETPAVLIGDSWAAGDGVSSAYPALLARALELDLRVSAVGGTGYLNEGACGGEPFGSRVDAVTHSARLVILAGGLNDIRAADEDLSAALDEMIAAVRREAPVAHIVVLGVPRVPLLEDELTGRADRVLRSAAGITFIDVRDWSIATLDDRIHPTPAGHSEYARRIVGALTDESALSWLASSRAGSEPGGQPHA